MESCVVCLSTNSDTLSRINFQSSEWHEFGIQRIIEKHLCWWHLKQIPFQNLPWICSQCWKELSSFHKFYLKVQKVHKQYDRLKRKELKLCQEESKQQDDTKILVIKQEINIVDDVQPLSEDLVLLEKFDKSIKKECSLTKTTHDLITNKFSPLEIKDEIITENNDYVQQKANKDVSLDNNLINFTTELPCNINQNCNSKLKKKTVITKNAVGRKCRKKSNTTPPKNVDSSAKLEKAQKNEEYLAQCGFKLFCDFCNIPFDDFTKLKAHFRLEHKIIGYAICCSKKFYNRGSLADHLRVHQNPNYFKCTICGRVLAHRISYKNHLNFHKQSRARPFSCDKCDKSFFKKPIYDRHILSHVPDEERKFQCDECDKKFAAECLLTQHKTFVHLNKYGKFCEICGKSFRDSFSFLYHMDSHNGAPPAKVPCDICGVELTNKYLLNRHKKKMHSEDNQEVQICPYCSKVSPNSHANNQHIRYAHTMERKHACHMCEKKFKRFRELKEHLSTHTGEPLYTCTFCPRTFISSANMHKHRKAGHPKEWEQERLSKIAAQKCRKISAMNYLQSNIVTKPDTSEF